MLFNSLSFLALLIVTFTLYYLPLFSRHQVKILIISSLIFYAYEQPELLFLLLISAAINIYISYVLVFGKSEFKKTQMIIGVVLNLCILGFFKYSPLFSNTFLNTQTGIGYFMLMIPLPIGISFYTFEGISLIVDVYSNKHKDVLTIDKSISNHLEKTLFFISFFPHLVSGPILKAYEFYPQIGYKKLADIDWDSVVKKLIMGYFLKMVVADNLTQQTFFIAYPYYQLKSSLTLVVMLLGYSFQIFADFAGYTLIALGLAKLFGYKLIDNFNFPYISTSFSEFWRRWHISLSTFLREYLYIPLGGNRKSNPRTYVNLTVTMLLGGLWHGAAWSYVVWGGFHGLALVIERVIVSRSSITITSKIGLLGKGVLVFLLVTLAWLLFKLPEFHYAVDYLRVMGRNIHQPMDSVMIKNIAIYSAPVVLYHIAYLFRIPSTAFFRNWEHVFYGILLFLLFSNSGPSASFVYFQF